MPRRLAITGHPHAGGEIPLRSTVGAWIIGPSPRGWGNLENGLEDTIQARAIPTRVGKSCLQVHSPCARPGHPHAGGEITETCRPTSSIAGPSPRGWGNPWRRLPAAGPGRAIPTRVGKSPLGNWIADLTTGHPHAGGEIDSTHDPRNMSSGPSPRGWGNH